MTPITTQTLENALTAKLMVSFGKTAAEATDGEMMRASALVLRDMMALREVETRQKARQQHGCASVAVACGPERQQPDGEEQEVAPQREVHHALRRVEMPGHVRDGRRVHGQRVRRDQRRDDQQHDEPQRPQPPLRPCEPRV